MQSEVFGIDRVHGGEVVHVLEVDVGLDDAVEGGACGFEDGLQILKGPTGLFGDPSGDKLLRRRIKSGLSCGEDEIAAANARNTNQLRLFEVGSVYLPRRGEKLPDEPRRLAFALAGPRQPEFWGQAVGSQPESLDFYDAKGVVESLLEELHIGGSTYEPATAPYLHPGRAAQLILQGRTIGGFGQLHPKTAQAFDLSGFPQVVVGEFDLEALLALIPARHSYTPIPRFPAALRDVAVIVD